MTVAHDNWSERATWTTVTPAEWTHSPTGTPRGVLVYIIQTGASTDQITGVTYGGVTMARVTTAADTATEQARVYAYFLGASIPTGDQTVSVTHTGTSNPKKGWAVSVTAAGNTEVADFEVAEENQANPQVALDTGADTSQRYVAVFSGLPNTPDLTDLGAQTRLDDNDFGAAVAVFSRQTSVASGSVTLGYTAGTDDVALVGVAIKESVAGTTHDGSASGASTSTGSANATIVSPITFSGSGSGASTSAGSGAARLHLAAQSSGASTSLGTAAASISGGSVTHQGTASGSSTSSGTAAGQIVAIVYQGTGSGASTSTGSSNALLRLRIQASGASLSDGTAAPSLHLQGTGSGASQSLGTASGNIAGNPVTWAGSGSGASLSAGTAGAVIIGGAVTYPATAEGLSQSAGEAAARLLMAVSASGASTSSGDALTANPEFPEWPVAAGVKWPFLPASEWELP